MKTTTVKISRETLYLRDEVQGKFRIKLRRNVMALALRYALINSKELSFKEFLEVCAPEEV